MELSHELVHEVIIKVSLVLSILGCLFNLIVSLFFVDHHNSIWKMVFVLSAIDLISSTSALIMSWWLNPVIYFIWFISRNQSIAWTCCFTHSLWVSYQKTIKLEVQEPFWIYLFTSILMVCLWSYSMGEIEALRNLSAKYSYSIPSVIGVVFCSYYYVKLYISLRKETSSSMILELLRFPLILICCNAYFFAFFISGISENEPWWLNICEICFNMQGLLNALVYALAINIWHTLKEKCRKKGPATNELSDSLIMKRKDFRASSTVVSSFTIV